MWCVQQNACRTFELSAVTFHPAIIMYTLTSFEESYGGSSIFNAS